MTFQDFRNEFENQLDTTCFKVVYPQNKKAEYFWITVLGTGIGSESCHYEFVHDGTELCLEIHFEFGTSEDYLSAIKLLNKKLLKKYINFRYPFSSNSHQVGITYKTFDLDSATLINDTINALKTMNKKFQKLLPKVLSSFYKNSSNCCFDKDGHTLSEITIYFTVLATTVLLVLSFPTIIVFLDWISNFKSLKILRKLILFSDYPFFYILFAFLVTVSIVCFTVFSIKMLKHTLTRKKINLLSQMESENISDENIKTYVNAITDL